LVLNLSGAGARFWLAITFVGAFASGALDADALVGAGPYAAAPDAAPVEEAALTDGALLDDEPADEAALEESAVLETGGVAGAVETAGAETAAGAVGTAGSGVPAAGSALGADVELAATTAVPEDSADRLPEAGAAATVLVEGNPESTKPAVVGGPAADDIPVVALASGFAGTFTATL
jgi:hypothetical protein